MIYTVTVNPAIDKIIYVDNFNINSVNRASKSLNVVGGKGINVSVLLKSFGMSSKCLGTVGGGNGEVIEKFLDTQKIDSRFLHLKSETRVNTKIVDLINNTFTDINESGSLITESEIDTLKEMIIKSINFDDLVVVSGSVLPNIKPIFYKDLIKELHKKNVKVVLDSSGNLLKHGITASPFAIKPNIYELEEIFNKKLTTIDEVALAILDLQEKYNVEYCMVSLDEKGLIISNNNKLIYAKALRADVKRTVGAGDSVVSSFVYSIANNFDLETIASYTIATATLYIEEKEITDQNVKTLSHEVELEELCLKK